MFVNQDCKPLSLSCLSEVPSAVECAMTDNWFKLRRVVDRDYLHMCGHASCSDMCTLLSRKRLWIHHLQQYLAAIVAKCHECKAVSSPPPYRRVSISSLDRSFH